jgi:chorismate-pyruvate lyase
MNFNELPKKVIADVLNTDVPLGKSLLTNHVKTFSTERSYFSVRYNKVLFSLTHCDLDSKLYGRTNTLIRADNNRWIAHVVEILPRFLK